MGEIGAARVEIAGTRISKVVSSQEAKRAGKTPTPAHKVLAFCGPPHTSIGLALTIETLDLARVKVTLRIMNRLIAMCGLSFSGKTTLAQAIAHRIQAAYISLDAINEERGLLGGQGIAPAEWERTSHIAADRANACLQSSRDVVLDDTLCFRWLRERYCALAIRAHAEFHLIYVATPISQIYASIELNDVTRARRAIRRNVFDEHARTFEPPTSDEQPIVYTRSEPVASWLERYF